MRQNIGGVEPDAKVAAKATALDHVLNGRYEDVEDQIPVDYFDLVICNDVIEHFGDHDAFLQSIKVKMTNDVVLVGSIPNVRYFTNLFHLLVNKEWQYKDEGILDTTHLRFFTEKSLQRTFIENSYEIM